MRITAKVTFKGPVLSGRAAPIVDRWLTQAVDTVSAEGLRRLHTREQASFKHPTGYYESRTVRDRRGNGYDLTDSRVVYGPWLEGISSRNQQSRFKGYHIFRLVGQQLDWDANAIAEPAVNAMMQELRNGN